MVIATNIGVNGGKNQSSNNFNTLHFLDSTLTTLSTKKSLWSFFNADHNATL